MDHFAQSSPEDRRYAFVQTSEILNMTPTIIEKDFWVCWILKELFALPEIGPHLIFKGGTSLAKVFKIIERFSEDIDISMDRGWLGFGGEAEPEVGTSNKEKRKRIEALKQACQSKIMEIIKPSLEEMIASKLGKSTTWTLRLDEEDSDRQTLLFEYPSSLTGQTAEYIQKMVKIEMGARADHWPYETRSITAYVAEQFPEAFQQSNCHLKVLSAERTFWEKATILHAEYHRPLDKSIPQRFSRHYSDFYELIRKGVAKSATTNMDLLARVARHKALFFKSGWARYEEASRGTLRISPPEYRIRDLREDYDKMGQMFFGIPADYDEMMSCLKQWETEFNRQ